MLLRTFGDDSGALRFNRSIALDERRKFLSETSATPTKANRLMKKNNSVDKGNDSFLFVKKMGRGFFEPLSLQFFQRSLARIQADRQHTRKLYNPLCAYCSENELRRKSLLLPISGQTVHTAAHVVRSAPAKILELRNVHC
jgi:hypothetical protein